LHGSYWQLERVLCPQEGGRLNGESSPKPKKLGNKRLHNSCCKFVGTKPLDAIGRMDNAPSSAVVSEPGGVSGVSRPNFLASSRVECLEDDSGCGVGSASTSVRLRAYEGFLSQPPGPELAFAGIEGGEGAEDVEGSSCSVAKIAAVKSPPAIGGDDEAVGPETGKDSDDAVSGDSESVGGVIDSDRGLVAHGRVDAAGKVSEAKTGEEVVSEVG